MTPMALITANPGNVAKIPASERNSPANPLKPGRPRDARAMKVRKKAYFGMVVDNPPKAESSRVCARS